MYGPFTLHQVVPAVGGVVPPQLVTNSAARAKPPAYFTCLEPSGRGARGYRATVCERRPYFRTIVTTTSTPALPTKGVKAQEVTGGRAGGDAVSLTSVYW